MTEQGGNGAMIEATARLGASHLPDGRTVFRVWAPRAERVELVLGGTAPRAMDLGADGYAVTVADDAPPGTRYRYRLHREGEDPLQRADPASRWQPDGLHGPSAVAAPDFAWTDGAWRDRPLHRQVLYELHVGTFTDAGTFDGVTERLADLAELGVTAIELLPVWQFPGTRNWGYDGVLAYAVQDSYGGPDGLRRLVDAAHRHGIAVWLDVVYNHVGPEGNHLADFGPYFTDRYDTPWGQAVNVDGPDSDPVRRYLIENAVRWVTDFHIDGLRLDAVHAIFDLSAVHLLEELAAAVHAAAADRGRTCHVVAESDLQDPRLVRAVEVGGYGLDGQWLDDVHHAIHVAVTGEQDGYYQDYAGLTDLAAALRDRYAIAGRYSTYRRRTVGRPAPDVPYHRFVACIQNHDQVGNRMLGDRLDALVDPERRKLAVAALLTAPWVPMLFMGEEYGDNAVFQYFVSHTEPDLIEAVRTGRREEFAAFAWQGEAPDPQAEQTFRASRLDWALRDHGFHATLLRLYRELLRLRREVSTLSDPDAGDAVPSVVPGAHALIVRRSRGSESHLVVLHAGDTDVDVTVPDAAGGWQVRLDTAAGRWDGPGSRLAAAAGSDHDTPGAVPTVDAIDGELALPLRPTSAVLLTRKAPA